MKEPAYIHSAQKKCQRIGIVLTHATQFDGPLFRYLSNHCSFEVMVYYTRTGELAFVSEDGELGTTKAWDIDVSTGYHYTSCGKGWSGWLSLMKRIVGDKHDLLIVCGYQPISHLAIALWARLHGKVVGLRSDSILSYGQPTGLKGFIKRWLLPFVMRIYSTGHPTGTLAREYLIQYGMEEHRTFLFPYNVDNDWLAVRAAEAATKRDELRRGYGIPAAAFVVLGVLKFVEREDPLTLVRAFAKLHESFPHSHLVMVGDGQLRKQVEAEIMMAGIADNVHLPGCVPYSRLPSYYAMADVFVHPARREPWGVSVNEAMVCGTAVVLASTVGAGRDLVDVGATGFVFEAGDPETLAAVLRRLVASPRLLNEVVAGANQKMRDWSYGQTAQEMERSLHYVATGRGGIRREATG